MHIDLHTGNDSRDASWNEKTQQRNEERSSFKVLKLLKILRKGPQTVQQSHYLSLMRLNLVHIPCLFKVVPNPGHGGLLTWYI